MRFGMSGCFLPADMDEVTPEICRRVRALGFTGIFTRFARNDPHTTPVAGAHRLRELLADEGVRLFQVTGYWQNLVNPDEGRRREAVRTLQAALVLAGHMGARAIDTGPGSMSPEGPWFPHSANWVTRETVYDTAAALNRDFDILDRQIVSCHAKDIWIENRLTLHLQDGCPGRGTLDFKTLFRRMEALSPDYPVIAEGNGTE